MGSDYKGYVTKLVSWERNVKETIPIDDWSCIEIVLPSGTVSIELFDRHPGADKKYSGYLVVRTLNESMEIKPEAGNTIKIKTC